VEAQSTASLFGLSQGTWVNSVLRKYLIPLLLVLILTGCIKPVASGPEPCSEGWNLIVEQLLVTGDDRGHGPDLGSAEWQSVVEFKLGLRGEPDVPQLGSRAWCRFIDRVVSTEISRASTE